jgi:hypothetical protein
MTTHITLKINSEVAERAKKYARKKKTTIEKIVESELVRLLQEQEIPSPVDQLAGILKDIKVTNARREFRDHQLKKHGS